MGANRCKMRLTDNFDVLMLPFSSDVELMSPAFLCQRGAGQRLDRSPSIVRALLISFR